MTAKLLAERPPSALKNDKGEWKATEMSEMTCYMSQGFLDDALYRWGDDDNRVLSREHLFLSGLALRIHEARCAVLRCIDPCLWEEGAADFRMYYPHIAYRAPVDAMDTTATVQEIGASIANEFAADTQLMYEIWFCKTVRAVSMVREGYEVTAVHVTDLTLIDCKARCEAVCIALLARSPDTVPWKDVKQLIARMVWQTRRSREHWSDAAMFETSKRATTESSKSK